MDSLLINEGRNFIGEISLNPKVKQEYSQEKNSRVNWRIKMFLTFNVHTDQQCYLLMLFLNLQKTHIYTIQLCYIRKTRKYHCHDLGSLSFFLFFLVIYVLCVCLRETETDRDTEKERDTHRERTVSTLESRVGCQVPNLSFFLLFPEPAIEP